MADKRIDVAHKVYYKHRPNTALDAVQNTPGFVWDKYRWLNPTYKNYNYGLPTNWDPSIGNLDPSYFRSGVTNLEDSCKVVHVVEEDGINADITKPGNFLVPSWQVGTSTGYYYLNSDKRYLYSDYVHVERPSSSDSFGTGSLGSDLVLEDTTQFYLSSIQQKQGGMTAGYIFERSSATGTVSPYKEFRHVSAFAGKTLEGHRKTYSYDDSYLPYLDTSKYEFMVVGQQNNSQITYQSHLGFVVDNTPSSFFEVGDTVSEGDVLIGSTDYFTTVVSNGTVLVAKLSDNYTAGEPPTFSREDIFQTSKPFSGGAPLVNLGDYSILEDGAQNVIAVVVDSDLLNNTPRKLDLGFAFYKNTYYYLAYFNNNYITYKTYRLDELDSDLIHDTADSGKNYFLQYFPYLDNSTSDYLDLLNVELYASGDSSSLGDKWTRVTSFTDIDTSLYTLPSDLANITNGNIYIFDSLNGVVYLNKDVEGTITLNAYECPVIFREPAYTNEMFHEKRYNTTEIAYSINPVLDSRGKFITLSDSPGNPYNITLELFQSDSIPGSAIESITSDDTDLYLVATVTDSDDKPVPNTLVHFTNDLGTLSPSSARTNQSGRAMVNFIAPWSFDDFGLDVYYYDEPDPSEGEAARSWTPAQLYAHGLATDPFDTTYVTRDTLILPEGISLEADVDVSEIYLFTVSSEDELQSYDDYEREGGRAVVWYKDDGAGTNILIPCIEVNVDAITGRTRVVFSDTVPSSYPAHLALLDPLDPNYTLYENTQKAVIITPRLVEFQAFAYNMYEEQIVSNTVDLTVELSTSAKGVWTLPYPNLGIWDGSKISTATYININP